MSGSSDIDTRVAVLEERLRNREQALVLQAEEYRRRLDELNHAHQRAEERNANFIGREVYEADRKEERVWRDEVKVVLAQLQGASKGTKSVWDLFFQILPLLVSLGVLAGMIWSKH